MGNLKELAPEMTLFALKDALNQAFIAEYGPAAPAPWQEALEEAFVHELAQKYRSWEWTYGKTPRFEITLENRFPWGSVELMLNLKNAVVQEARCFSDANDPELSARAEAALIGCPFTPQALSACLRGSEKTEDRELADWLLAQKI